MKIAASILFCLFGIYCCWRFFVSLRYADEKIGILSVFSRFRYYLLFAVFFVPFGLYDIWIGSTLTPLGIQVAPYLDTLFIAFAAFWGGISFAEMQRMPYTKRRKLFDSLSLFCVLASIILLSFVQRVF